MFGKPNKANKPVRTRKLKWWIRVPIQVALICSLIAGILVATFAIIVAITPIPPVASSLHQKTSVVYYSDGVSELGWLGEVNRRPVPLANVSVPVQEAFIAAEDRDFYSHFGFSPWGTGRALMNNLSGSAVQGGSTITQQYVKNAFLSSERTWERKFKEVVLAVKLETLNDKDTIFEDYLNAIYFGRGAYGVEAAAQTYFGVPVSELDAAQGAVLVVLANAPSFYSGSADRLPLLKEKWGIVLDSMVGEGFLSASERAGIVFPELRERVDRDRLGGQTGYLLDMVRAELRGLGFSRDGIDSGGLRVVSTFDRRLQRAAVRAVGKVGPSSGQGARVGLVSIDPATGGVVALYGGPDFVSSPINNATRRYAQAGSVFKTFALVAATEERFGPDSLWPGDSPLTVGDYTVRNNDNTSYGVVSLREATAFSVNTAFVALSEVVGVGAVADAGFRMGLPRDTPGLNTSNSAGLSFVLGTASPSVLDVAGVYAVLADGGVRRSSTVIRGLVSPLGSEILVSRRSSVAMSKYVAGSVTSMLAGSVQSGTAVGAQLSGVPGVAGKTGTSDGSRSMWFAGYTPGLSTAVMVSRDAVGVSGLMSVEGLSGGSPDAVAGYPISIWSEFMFAAAPRAAPRVE